MAEFSILHIILFIAMSLCPEKVDTFSIKGPDTMITVTKKDGGWRADGSGALWSKEKTKVSRILREKKQVCEVSKFIGVEITKHNWEKRDVYVNKFLRIQKTDKGFTVTDGTKGKHNESYIITYKTSAQDDAGQSAQAENSIFRPLVNSPDSNEEEFFKVADGEVKIEGHVIKLFVIKPKYLTASYKNDSKKSLSPKYTVRVYNRYGYLLGGDKTGASVFGGSPNLEIGDVGGEKIRLDWVDIASVFKHTNLDLPADFFDAAWVSLAASNTKLVEQDGDGQPATALQPKSEGKEKSKSE